MPSDFFSDEQDPQILYEEQLRTHCVRCHEQFDPKNPSGCKIRAGRDVNSYYAFGAGIVELCLQCYPKHSVDEQPFCFEGNHTIKISEVEFEVNTGHPDFDPEPKCCSFCQEYKWER